MDSLACVVVVVVVVFVVVVVVVVVAVARAVPGWHRQTRILGFEAARAHATTTSTRRVMTGFFIGFPNKIESTSSRMTSDFKTCRNNFGNQGFHFDAP